ncbi:hypothetical protein GCM10010992_06390 [Cloacibacterium rupense]|uniref:Uncharacterized protein n=1 Tax=Cloacibacterium rupense TaxID=517423 RepID=A0ABQ2NG05_9FLAO|nr:hypothetical protein [Cloacibacterium rupense]GGP02352.1 hypothetical protein GCM10010992_06390 [Cloacibacterium rupense]
MAYTIVGLFPSQENSKKVSEGLENIGFKNEDYIIYLEEKKPVHKSFWAKLFTENIDEEAMNVDSLIVSVGINNNDELENAKKVFKDNSVVNIYTLEELDFGKAVDLEYVKKVVALKAKSLIYAMPQAKTSSTDIHTGISSEVGS